MANLRILDIMLWDDGAEGTLRCELNTKDLVLFRVSRGELSSATIHKELSQCGVYFLIGEENGKPAVYIGQANFRKNNKGVLGRAIEHDKAKESFWSTAVMVISKSDSIGATELNYLEHTCVAKASNAARYVVKNANNPTIGKVATKTQILMDDFISDIIVIFRQVLRYEVFVPAVNTAKNANNKYFIKRDSNTPGRSCDATCEVRGSQYVVLAGSKLCTAATASGKKAAAARKKYNGHITKAGVLQCDAVFSSSSGASTFVLYSSSNGNVEWKDKNGIALAD